MMALRLSLVFVFSYCLLLTQETNGASTINAKARITMDEVNKNGPYLGVVIPNLFEMNPLLQSSTFNPTYHLDISGRRFRFGTIHGKKIVLVMTGLGMVIYSINFSSLSLSPYVCMNKSQINAAVTTQLLLSMFNIKGVVHYGIAGNANPSLHIGDVTIPQYWARTALWSWQRFGNGPDDELPLEANGDYTREIGYIEFKNYTTSNNSVNPSCKISYDNLLNNVWYQPEEVFPVDGTPEERQHAFWIPVDNNYYSIAKKLEGLKLESCINKTTCLSTPPKVTRVTRGTSASIYLDNAAYRSFIYNKFKASPVEMESAAVALICHQQRGCLLL